MSDVAVRVDGVYKKFRRGELYDSLRELIPALTGSMFRRKELNAADRREFWALEAVSFEVYRGEAFGIIGHNGAGKSTLLKILSRIMQPTKGRIIVQGRLSALIEISAGFHQDLTGRENIYLNGTILGMTRTEIDSKLDAIIAFSGLDEFIDTPVKRYSSGMFARLGFSVAAHVDPEVLVVDEVLSVGDFTFQQKCINKMNAVLNSGTTVLFVSHNLHAVADLCRRAVLLDHGKVRDIGDTRRIIAQYIGNVRTACAQDSSKPVFVAHVRLKRGEEEATYVEPGDRVRLEVEACASSPCDKVVVAVTIRDDRNYLLFLTSSVRLGFAPYSLKAGARLCCDFDVSVNLSYGRYSVGAVLYRHDTDTTLDEWEPAASFFVGGRQDAFIGVVDCRPELARQQIVEDT